MTETWLITGGCGFVGLNLVDALRSSNKCTVRIFDNLSVGSREALGAVTPFVEDETPEAAVRLIVGDIRDKTSMAKAAEGVDVIVHLAANAGIERSLADPILDADVNVIGTLNCLEAARHAKARRFILASSAAVGAAAPTTPYGAGKLAGEAYCAAYKAAFGLETVALRFANVYGPRSGHKQSVVAAFVAQALRGDPLTIHGGGRQRRSFIHAARLPVAPTEPVGIPGPELSSIQDLARQLDAEFSRQRITAVWKDGPVQQGEPPPRGAQPVGETLPGWQPRIRLREGLADTLGWYLGHKPRGWN
jgi:UDP-glucose 4-epimerase